MMTRPEVDNHVDGNPYAPPSVSLETLGATTRWAIHRRC